MNAIRGAGVSVDQAGASATSVSLTKKHRGMNTLCLFLFANCIHCTTALVAVFDPTSGRQTSCAEGSRDRVRICTVPEGRRACTSRHGEFLWTGAFRGLEEVLLKRKHSPNRAVESGCRVLIGGSHRALITMPGSG